jgi:phospholipid/cholesterol/gamma-HCH transport system permease protein
MSIKDDTMAQQDYIDFDKRSHTLVCKGEWNLENITELLTLIKKINIPAKTPINIDGKSIEKLDSAGVWLLTNGIEKSIGNKVNILSATFSKQQQKLLELVKKDKKSSQEYHSPDQVQNQLNLIQKIGKYGINQKREFHQYLSFIGELFFDGIRIALNVTLWRWNAIVSVVNKSGAQALPIIALLSFMIGVVISYQMGNQLEKYGADIYVVDLLGLSVLREFGPLLTAIMVGGRTGSSFTAQIGIMKINLEIDALQTMGIKPTQILLLPRIAGLFIVVPLLTIWADIFGVFGGMVMANQMFDIGWYDFMLRFQQEVSLRSLIIGLAKAPVFALIIASLGCFEGMKVHGSAESVGVRTTRSVVLAIFFIIIFDAFVSVLLSRYKL